MLFTVAAGGGSVAPDSVTTDTTGVATVGSWTLGTTKGQNLLIASIGQGLEVSFTATAAQNSTDIDLSIYAPKMDTLVGDTLSITVAVTSRYELASVNAAVGDRHADLSYSTQSHRWEGALPLNGLPRDTLQLAVTATDVNGSATDAFVRFVHDRKPTLTVTTPADSVIARPSIDFSADCTDDDPAGCRSLVVAVTANKFDDLRTLATGQSQVSGTASLADFDGSNLFLKFKATDSRGQVVQVFRQIYVEASTKLSEIITVAGRPMDLRGDQVLYRGTDGVIALRDITSGTTQPIYGDTVPIVGGFAPYGFVTSAGAIFAVGAATSPYAKLLEWRNGALIDLGGLNSGESLEVSGQYAIFSNGTNLTRRDIATGANVTVSTNAGNWRNGVAPNGDVVFWSSGTYRVYRYRDGTTTLLTPDDGTGRWNTWVVTDGINVVYRKSTPCCSSSSDTYDLVLHTSTGDTVLVHALAREPFPGRNYAVDSGWTAFTSPDIGGALQIWTRSPTGELRQVSFFGTDSRISALASDGTVVFENGSRRYLVRPGGTAQDIMSNLGTVLWRDGRFIVLIGHTVFAIGL